MSLRVRDLCAFYGRIQVCRGIGFEVESGEILVILGPNGAGKSSTLGAVAGQVSSSGEVRVARAALSGLSARARARRGLALVPEGRRNLFATLTVTDNLRLGLRMLPAAERPAMQRELLQLFPSLGDRLSIAAGSMSGGEQQMLALAVALARRPDVLLLDEPSQGLAPSILKTLGDAIVHLRRRGLAVVIAEQNHTFASRLASRYLVLNGGTITGGGSGAELAQREVAAAAMLGR
ncbi:MAG: ABC transporter ATP-binding protein [Candidatus Velthaea sp.]